ncbi:hypothetical protein PPERSA_02934 [Pseudocohnilembus persalinus]|uniref:DUF4200 domain-containing protein n=1 Tax=Pseudocohnilembus persalinus TaxID=266149 RepID=A0A0V0QA55_PSEPJ|nr:hypothetical protein PPERSA_02934 [Pseudocohnilembus persalinus]|eukprot:KRW99102.1 hypothetical protein PPERSA_02934 [Pseudocohnilembus persalinus]
MPVNDRLRSKTQFSELSQSQKRPSSGQLPPKSYNKFLFKVPVDDEVFEFQQEQKQKELNEKIRQRGISVEEKITKSTRPKLMNYKNYQAQQIDNFVPKLNYSNNKKKLIQYAHDYTKQRSLSRDTATSNSRQSINQILAQKKEMFQVTMINGIIEKEIHKLKTITSQKESALEQTKMNLDADLKNFNDYKEKNKKNKEDAQKEEELAIRERKRKEDQIKKLNLEVSKYKQKIERCKEDLIKYLEHKEFLDELAPYEYTQKRDKELKIYLTDLAPKIFLKLQDHEIDEFINNLEQIWIKENLELDFQKQQWKEKIGIANDNDQKSQKENSQNFQNSVNLYKSLQKNDSHSQFKNISQINKIMEFKDDYPMFFQESLQLKEFFQDMETNSLFKMERIQAAQQDLEEQQQRYKNTELPLKEKASKLQQDKENIQKEIQLITQECQQLEKKINVKVDNINDNSSNMRMKIIEILDSFPEEIRQAFPDDKNQSTKSLLTSKAVHNQRKKQQREEKAHIIKADQEEKIRRNREKILKPSVKRTGRIQMFKMSPVKKEVKQEKVTEEVVDDLEKYLDPNFKFQA